MGSIRAAILFSGGLDSLLAYRIVEKQGVEAIAIIFATPFFPPDKAIHLAEVNSLKFRVIDISDTYLKEVLISPEHGYGKRVNPCIDCHLFMIRAVGRLIDRGEFDFLVTGEVVGQRPMSQTMRAIKDIGVKSGLEDLVLRPLSAKLLDETLAEKNGWVKREDLFAIEGRSRAVQIELADKYGLKEYSSPAGGCLLTDPGFSRRARVILDHFTPPEAIYFEAVKWGRIFHIGTSIIIIGRNKSDNDMLRSLIIPEAVFFETINVPGPDALLISYEGEADPSACFPVLARYADGPTGAEIVLEYTYKGVSKKVSVKKKPIEINPI